MSKKCKAKIIDRKTRMVMQEKEFESRDKAENWAIEQSRNYYDSTDYSIEDGD